MTVIMLCLSGPGIPETRPYIYNKYLLNGIVYN